jgi:hypothetical protein
MSTLRLLGLIIGVLSLLLTFSVYRGPRWKKGNFILLGIFSISLILVSLNPDVLNIVAGILKLEQRQRGRIIAILIGSNLILWFFLFYIKTKLDEFAYQFDLLVRKLGQEDAEEEIGTKASDKQIIVVIPAHNESRNLREILPRIPDQIENQKVGVLVVDDGSLDGTASLVKSMGHLCVRNKIKRGGGAALRSAFDLLNLTDANIIVTMDGDGQHLPEEIDKLVIPIIQDKYDIVIGSRILGTREEDKKSRFFGILFFNAVIRLLLGIKITDCSSGFRAFKKDLLDKVLLQEDQYHTSELLIDAAKKNMRIGEIPVTILRRKYGKSKKGGDLKYGLHFAKTIFKTWWR